MVHCPQVSILHACALVAAGSAGVLRQGGRGCAQGNLAGDRDVKAAISIAVRAPMEREGQELPAYVAQAKSKKMQAMRAEGRLGRSELDPTQPRDCSIG